MMESPKDMPDPAQQAMQTPDPSGPTRHPNHWSVEAREDMFGRREAGEGWETICKDYPNRTRHAMQQQYSMMKKQRAQANGTWTPVQRGRKRKLKAPPGKWAAVNISPTTSDEDNDDEQPEEEDDDDDDDDEEVEHTDAGNGAPNSSYRPSISARSATEPSSRPSVSKPPMFPNLPSSADLPTKRLDDSRDFERVVTEPNAASYPNKKRKYSTDPSEKSDMLAHDSPTLFFKIPGIVLDPEEESAMQSILAKGKERACSMAMSYEAEKALQRRTFEDSVKRANRRANEAENKLRTSVDDYAEKLKLNDREHADESRALKDELEAAKRQWKENQEISVAYAAEIQTLKEELQAEKERNSDTDSVNELRRSLTESENQLSMKEDQLKLYDQLRLGFIQEGRNMQDRHRIADDHLNQARAQYDKLTASLASLNVDLEEIGMKLIKKFIRDVLQQNQDMTTKFEQTRKFWTDASDAVTAFHTQCSSYPNRSLKDAAADLERTMEAL